MYTWCFSVQISLFMLVWVVSPCCWIRRLLLFTWISHNGINILGYIFIFIPLRKICDVIHTFLRVRYKFLGIIIIQLFDFVQFSKQHSNVDYRLITVCKYANYDLDVFVGFNDVTVVSNDDDNFLSSMIFFSAVLLLLWKLFLLHALHS